ncbi:FliA/WhiG family RNA polymerase sigma factor [Serpentinicella sp. ANB-PHB4]|uniref:FliA/WhiG family RNA polymerase sigma factor n=1 Tax=Serpentinicella sp. ANB-PHB4 TaxID=3074076 RepID=UPI00285EBBE4|nr:FliA/WhiG family RNA polymerase sigma factor [Serpentinicella sp. ANB-PHB4]MDR5658241.1 FliA/WhiG family RNA polymerase sigma factor [Serpentinicella sp. ANB-PHB4]
MNNKALWIKYKNESNSEAKNQLIEKYVHLVKIISGRLYLSYNSNIEYDDLIGYGIFGLIDAIEKYDIKKEIKFETYAQIRIRGAIIDQLRNLDWVPRSVRQKSKLVDQTYIKLENKLGRNPTEAEVANELNITRKELDNIIQQTNSFNFLSFEETLSNGTLINREDAENEPEQLFCNKERINIIRNIIDKLPEKEKQVISLYYYDEVTYKEIAFIMGISESRISQIHSKAIKKIKIELENEG